MPPWSAKAISFSIPFGPSPLRNSGGRSSARTAVVLVLVAAVQQLLLRRCPGKTITSKLRARSRVRHLAGTHDRERDAVGSRGGSASSRRPCRGRRSRRGRCAARRADASPPPARRRATSGGTTRASSSAARAGPAPARITKLPAGRLVPSTVVAAVVRSTGRPAFRARKPAWNASFSSAEKATPQLVADTPPAGPAQGEGARRAAATPPPAPAPACRPAPPPRRGGAAATSS